MKSVFEAVGHLDRRAYEEFGLSEDVLMEHAALGIQNEILKLVDVESILIVCGPGNNGADGLALARLLQSSFDVTVHLPFGAKSHMAQLQLKRARALGIALCDTFPDSDLIVDALFGSGLNKPLDQKSTDLLRELNQRQGHKIACDVPSGLFQNGNHGEVFYADTTVSMGALKLAYFYDHTKDICGRVVNINLGLAHEKYIATTRYFQLEPSDMRLPYRNTHDTHKGTYGHVAVLEGAMPGAPTMTALAALEFGAGLATIVGYEHHDYPYMLMHSGHIPATANVLALGMGLGESSYEDGDVLQMCRDRSLVIDADLFHKPLIATLLKENEKIVITPHPKEFATLLHTLNGDEYTTEEILKEKFRHALDFSKSYPDIVLILKGVNTLIAHQGKIYIASLGTPALAKGGSGDILAGMVAALLAQGYLPLEAAITAVIAHSLAAGKVDVANYALTPDKLIGEIGRVGE